MKSSLLLLAGLVTLTSFSQSIKTYDQVLKNDVTFKMVALPGGKFQIGSKSASADPDESPTVEVEITQFWIAEHEVTFGEWDLYFNDASLPQSKNIDGVTRATPQYIDLTWGMGRDSNHPVNSLSHQAAMMYCKWLFSKTGFFYRLPTEAEWEYACKGNSPSFVMAPEELKAIAYFKDDSDNKFHHVKEKKPSVWGIYDMLGNVSEWTIDQYDADYYTKIKSPDPITIPGPKYPRSTRGGSFQDTADQLRCSNRTFSDPKWNQRDPQIPKSRWWLTDGMFMGFRVVRPQNQPSREEIEKFYAQYLK